MDCVELCSTASPLSPWKADPQGPRRTDRNREHHRGPELIWPSPASPHLFHLIRVPEVAVRDRGGPGDDTAVILNRRGVNRPGHAGKEPDMAIGPVQLIALGFPDPNFHGEIIAELDRLRESDTVRVIDALAVYKDDAGDVEVLHLSNLSREEAIELGSVIGALIGLGEDGTEGAEAGAVVGAELAAEDGVNALGDVEWDVLDDIPNGSAAALILLEQELVGATTHRAPGRPWGRPRQAVTSTAGLFQLSSAITAAEFEQLKPRLEVETRTGRETTACRGTLPGRCRTGVQRQPFGPVAPDRQRFSTTCPPTRTTVPPPRASAGRGPPTREQECVIDLEKTGSWSSNARSISSNRRWSSSDRAMRGSTICAAASAGRRCLFLRRSSVVGDRVAVDPGFVAVGCAHQRLGVHRDGRGRGSPHWPPTPALMQRRR
jgi:uncharacterized membrane protein